MNNYPTPESINEFEIRRRKVITFMVPEYGQVVVAEETTWGFSGSEFNKVAIGVVGVVAALAIGYYLHKRLRR